MAAIPVYRGGVPIGKPDYHLPEQPFSRTGAEVARAQGGGSPSSRIAEEAEEKRRKIEEEKRRIARETQNLRASQERELRTNQTQEILSAARDFQNNYRNVSGDRNAQLQARLEYSNKIKDIKSRYASEIRNVQTASYNQLKKGVVTTNIDSSFLAGVTKTPEYARGTVVRDNGKSNYVDTSKKIKGGLNKFAETVFGIVSYPQNKAFENIVKRQGVQAATGEQEFFGGTSASQLLPYQSRGTAVTTDIKFLSDKELQKKYPFGATEEIARRTQGKVDVNSLRVINKNIEANKNYYNNQLSDKLDSVAKNIQSKINSGEMTLEEGREELTRKSLPIINKVNQDFKEKVLSDSEPELESITKDAQKYVDAATKNIATEQAVAKFSLNVATGAGIALASSIPFIGPAIGTSVLTAGAIKTPEVISAFKTNPKATGIELGGYALGGLLTGEGIRYVKEGKTLTGESFRTSKKTINKVIENINKNINDVAEGKLPTLFSAQATQILAEFYRGKKKKKKPSSDTIQEITDVLEDLKEKADKGDSAAAQKMNQLMQEVGNKVRERIRNLPRDEQLKILQDLAKWIKHLKQKGIVIDTYEIVSQSKGQVGDVRQTLWQGQGQVGGIRQTLWAGASVRSLVGQKGNLFFAQAQRQFSQQKSRQSSILSFNQAQLKLQAQRQKQSFFQFQPQSQQLLQQPQQPQTPRLKSANMLNSPQLSRFGIRIRGRIGTKKELFVPKPPSSTTQKILEKLKEIKKKKQSVDIITGIEMKKQREIAKRLPPYRALKMAQDYVDRNIEASFRLKVNKKPPKRKDIDSVSVSRKFRPSKRNPLYLVEKRKYRLDFPKEKSQIKRARKR